MTYPNEPSYDHGSSGTEPGTSIDYANGDAVDPSHFDYYWYTLFNQINQLISALEALDSNNDNQVDAADFADDAANITQTVEGFDIDTDGDGVLNEALEVEGPDGSSHKAGSLPQFADESTGLNNTSEGDVFYDLATNSFVENTG